MSRPEDTKHGRCQATAKSTGKQCGRAAVGEHGKCGIHGGKSPGAPEGNDNAVGNEGGDPDGSENESHGLRSEPGPYYERQSESEQERIDEWAESWARRAGYDGLGFDKLFQTHAIKLHQVEEGDAYIDDEGAIAERVVARTETGEPIRQGEENPAFGYQSRALKDIMRFLKEFGCLDDPDSQQADAAQGIISVLSSEANNVSD